MTVSLTCIHHTWDPSQIRLIQDPSEWSIRNILVEVPSLPYRHECNLLWSVYTRSSEASERFLSKAIVWYLRTIDWMKNCVHWNSSDNYHWHRLTVVGLHSCQRTSSRSDIVIVSLASMIATPVEASRSLYIPWIFIRVIIVICIVVIQLLLETSTGRLNVWG